MKTKVLISIFALAYLSSCSLFWTDAPELPVEEPCPVVIIPRDIAYVTQKVNYIDDFQIELKGYSGYCYFDKRINRRKAVIIPQFEVRRLRQNLDETDVDFTYFTETIKGPPEYLGKKRLTKEKKFLTANNWNSRYPMRTMAVLKYISVWN